MLLSNRVVGGLLLLSSPPGTSAFGLGWSVRCPHATSRRQTLCKEQHHPRRAAVRCKRLQLAILRASTDTSPATLRPRPPWAHGLGTGRNLDLFAIAGSGGSSADFSGVSSTGEAFCDQCGDAVRLEASGLMVLAVCRAPGCGVEFSQCVRCEREYAGCCSVACQDLATSLVVSQGTEQMLPTNANQVSRREGGGTGDRGRNNFNGDAVKA
ncbi:unnamed protein product, partial [Laminaria digitata]